MKGRKKKHYVLTIKILMGNLADALLTCRLFIIKVIYFNFL